MKIQINRDLIRLIEEYAGSLNTYSDVTFMRRKQEYQRLTIRDLLIRKSIDLPTLPYPKKKIYNESKIIVFGLRSVCVWN